MGLFDDWTKTKSTQTSTATKNPWDPAQGGLLTGLDEASRLYGSGVGGQVYGGKTVADMSGYTKAGMNDITNLAGQGVPGLDAAYGYANDMIANNGMTADLNKTAGYLDNFANGSYTEDPRLAAAIKARETRAADTAASYASGSGRYGSGAMGSTMGTAVADAGNELMLNSNENARNRQLQASGMLGNLYEGGLSRAAGAVGMLPGLNELRYDPAGRLLAVGAAREGYAQKKLDSKKATFDQRQISPWENLQRYQSYFTNAGQLGGSTSGTATGTANPSLLQDAAAVGGIIGSGVKSYNNYKSGSFL